MNFCEVKNEPNIEMLIDISDYVEDFHPSSELCYSHHEAFQEPIRSSTQELISDSKYLIAQAKKLMSDYTNNV